MHIDPQRRVIIENVKPELDCGRFAIKRVVGESVLVEADIFTDGQDLITCVLLHRAEEDSSFAEVPMEALGNDRWQVHFRVDREGSHIYTISAWVDPFKTWYSDLKKRISAMQDITVDLKIGAEILKAAAGRAIGPDRDILASAARSPTPDSIDAKVQRLAEKYADRTRGTTYKELRITVDRTRARFSTWYEMFPRSHGNFRSVAGVLPEIAEMGFDVLYFPPIHPIGRKHRKGRNNSPESQPGEPGSPWAIGADEGGHKSVHPDLGTIEDFQHLLKAAKSHGMEIALDLAYQCAPDHPYVKEHPEWFRWRPNGTIQYAENPPKKYEDIYPFDFDTKHQPQLWNELKSVVEFWIEQGVRIFRVDNPHTKPFDFWEWMLADVRSDFSVRSVHSSEDHVPSGEAWVHSVVHVFHLAECQTRARGVFHGADTNQRQGIFPAEPVAQYAGHSPRVPADGGQARVHHTAHPCRNAGGQLWHLRACL
jgi:starch synthase (maltosyl-transferring)